MSTRTHGRRIVTCVAVLVVAVSACTPGVTEPSTTTSVPGPSGQTSTSPPPVTRPLDASAYRDKMCDLFTDEQAKEYGFDKPGTARVESDRVECVRIGPSGSPALAVSFYDMDLLGSIYRREFGLWGRNAFINLTIAGQPALRTNMSNAQTYCRVAVGLAEDQSVLIYGFFETATCDRIVAIAEVVVHTLGG